MHVDQPPEVAGWVDLVRWTTTGMRDVFGSTSIGNWVRSIHCSRTHDPAGQLTHLQRCAAGAARSAEDGIVLVHRRGRHEAPRLHHSAAGVRCGEEVSGEVPDSRRAAGRVGRRLELPLERGAVCRQRLRRRHDQSARVDGIWAGDRGRRERRLGRQAFYRPDDGPGLRGAALSASSTRTASARWARATADTWRTGSWATRTASSAS